uniref:Uncharacterized protein n=1 Tax=Knipowitschia caucasica TaxID=637954 RepID=A0AAV2L7J1_KNICA
MGDWSFLGRLLENAQEHSTVIGKIYHLGWKKVKQGVTNEFSPTSESLLLGSHGRGDAVTVAEQSSPPVHDCLPTYNRVSEVNGAPAEGGTYSPIEVPMVIPLNPNTTAPPYPLKAGGDSLMVEGMSSPLYEKVSIGSHSHIAAMEQNWSNMALELQSSDGKNSPSSDHPTAPSPPSSASSSPQQEMTPPHPDEELLSSFPTLPRDTPLNLIAPKEEPESEESPSPDDFTIVTKAEMHPPPAALLTDIQRSNRACKPSIRARPDDLAV